LSDLFGNKVRVLNAGTISYGAYEELSLLTESGLRERPSVVVHALYWNDYLNASGPRPNDPSVLTPDGYFVWDRPTVTDSRRLASEITNRSALLFVTKAAARRVLIGDEGKAAYGQAHADMVSSGLTSSDWKVLQDFYRTLTALGEEHDFAVFVVILPVVDALERGGVSHPYAIEARRILDEAGVPYLDAFAVWDRLQLGTEGFLPQGPDAHLNAEGYAALADAIAEALAEEPAIARRLRAAADGIH
jgi:hypothetical protein